MSKKVWDDDFYSPVEDVLSEEEVERIERQTAQYLSQPAPETKKEPEYEVEPDSIEQQLEEAIEETYTEEELEEDPDLIFNARMRLEQGRLYEMLLNHNLFEGASAHPKAVANVERELKTFIKERLEVLLGLKPDPKIVKNQTQNIPYEFPFNELEITLLKQALSRMTKGATEKHESPANSPKPVAIEQETKIKPLTISEPKKVALPSKEPVKITVKKRPEPQAKAVTQPAPAQKVVSKKPIEEPPPLKKHPYEMSASELMARNKYISEKQKRSKAVVPDHQKLPMPSADELTMHYSSRLARINPVIEKIIQHLPNSETE
jgi:hypothetical protein